MSQMNTKVFSLENAESGGSSFQALLLRAVSWPLNAWRARRDMGQLCALSDRELQDIGLTRTDLSAASALDRDENPTVRLAQIVSTRRRNARFGLRA